MEENENTFNQNIAINQACAIIRKMLNDEKFFGLKRFG
jgi:hypothetical protein